MRHFLKYCGFFFLDAQISFRYGFFLVTEYYGFDTPINFWDVYNIELDMMDEYVVAYTERLRDGLGDRLLTRGNWGDAQTNDTERFFLQKLQCSPGSLGVLGPDLYEVGPGRVKAFANKHNASVTAGVDAKLLRNGPIEAIVARIKLYIDKMVRDGRCMIHLNHIPAETPPEHIHAAVAACHT